MKKKKIYIENLKVKGTCKAFKRKREDQEKARQENLNELTKAIKEQLIVDNIITRRQKKKQALAEINRPLT